VVEHLYRRTGVTGLVMALALLAPVAELAAGAFVGGATGFRLAANVHMLVLIYAAYVCWAGVRYGDPTERQAWTWFTRAFLVMIIGSTVSAISGTLDISWLLAPGEAIRLAGALLLVQGLRLLPKGPNEKTTAQYIVDAGVAVSCFVLIAWLFFHDAVDPRAGLGMGAVTAIRPFVDALLGTAMVMALVAGRSAGGIAIRRLFACSVAVLLIGLGDAATALTSAEYGHPTAYSLIPLTTAALLIAWAARAPDDNAGGLLMHRLIVGSTSPLIPMLSAFGAIVYLVSRHRPADTLTVSAVIMALSFIVVALVYGRFSHFETREQMEQQVSERTMQLGTRERWFRSLVQNSSDVVTVMDVNGVIRYQTPSVQRVLGHDPALMLGTTLASLMRPADARRLEDALAAAAAQPDSVQTLEFPLWHRDGRWRETETTVTSLVDEPHVRGIVLNTRDVSERRRLQNELMHQAYSDALTGLANRALFRERTRVALSTAGTSEVAVLFLDLNGFKAVNDTQGHAVGDRLLSLVGQRLKNSVRPGDLVARLGGDEFGILVTGDSAEDGAVWVADRVRRVLAHDFELDGRQVTLGAAIGIALNESGAESADQLLSNADLAMYRAKSSERSDFVRFEAAMHEDLLARVQAEADLRNAVNQGDLVLHFQPIVELDSGDVVGVEALARWTHPVRGIIEPSEFIDVAEQTGLVDRIGAWAIDECARHAARWQQYAQEPGGQFRIAVNVSARQLTPGFPEVVRSALRRNGVTGSVLTLEVTESVLMDRPEEVIEILREVKELGVRIAVDDFGTGYSSLSYLARFPVDVLKIDRSFVEHVTTRSEKSELARTIVQLSRSLGLITVAEGIETPEQHVHMQEMGCPLGQGFLFAKPMPADGVDGFMADRTRSRSWTTAPA
jgi:diguanylate cyclase (GGDEF)-like protein/PAS domain S-box-containing protein